VTPWRSLPSTTARVGSINWTIFGIRFSWTPPDDQVCEVLVDLLTLIFKGIVQGSGA
jgi:hypothetical protein